MTIKLYSYKDQLMFEHTEPGNTEKKTLEYARSIGMSLKEVYVFNKDLSGIDLSGMNLNRTGFLWCDLRGANLSNCRFKCSVFNEANMEGVNLSGSHLYGASLGRCKLKGADLSHANLFEAKMGYSDLSNANLYGAYVFNTSMKEAITTGVAWGGNCLPDEQEDSNYIIYPKLGSESRTLHYNIAHDTIKSGCFTGTREEYILFYQRKYVGFPYYLKQYDEVFNNINQIISKTAHVG